MLPVGMDLHIFMFQPVHVQETMTDFTRNLVQAFVFVVLVMFAFVGWWTGAVAGLMVPMANVLMFGLAFSTLLTMLLSPVLYVLVFGIKSKSR